MSSVTIAYISPPHTAPTITLMKDLYHEPFFNFMKHFNSLLEHVKASNLYPAAAIRPQPSGQLIVDDVNPRLVQMK